MSIPTESFCQSNLFIYCFRCTTQSFCVAQAVNNQLQKVIMCTTLQKSCNFIFNNWIWEIIIYLYTLLFTVCTLVFDSLDLSWYIFNNIFSDLYFFLIGQSQYEALNRATSHSSYNFQCTSNKSWTLTKLGLNNLISVSEMCIPFESFWQSSLRVKVNLLWQIAANFITKSHKWITWNSGGFNVYGIQFQLMRLGIYFRGMYVHFYMDECYAIKAAALLAVLFCVLGS